MQPFTHANTHTHTLREFQYKFIAVKV